MQTQSAQGPRPVADLLGPLLERIHVLARIKQIDSQRRSVASEFAALTRERATLVARVLP